MTYITLAIAIITLSQAAVLVRLAGIPAEALGFWRVLMAAGLLAGAITYRREWKQFRLIITHHLPTALLAGVFFFLHFWAWFTGVPKTTVANATLFFCMNPLFVTILGRIFLKETVGKHLGVALVLGVTGILVIEWDAFHVTPQSLVGDSLVLLASLTFAAYILATKKIRAKVANVPFTFFINLCCLFGFTSVALVSHTPLLGYPTQSYLAILGLALGPSILGHSFLSYSLKFIRANIVSCLTLTEPVLAAGSGYFFFDETLSQTASIGYGIVIVGILSLLLDGSLRSASRQAKT